MHSGNIIYSNFFEMEQEGSIRYIIGTNLVHGEIKTRNKMDVQQEQYVLEGTYKDGIS